MNTTNGNFIEKSIPDNSDATIIVKIGNSDSTMNLTDFKSTMAPAPAYKVFTALLTQSGGDVPLEFVGSGTLTIGVTYFISDNASNPDFTNVGAPNNNVGTYFVATGTTPASWGEATLNYNTGAPVVTVLENTIGNVWFTYNGVGSYIFNSNELFTENKTVAFVTPNYGNDYNIIGIGYGDINFGEISTISTGNLTEGTNGLLYNTPIEIRVYL